MVQGNFTNLGSTSGNVRIGITNDNEIDTSTGNLTIDSAGGTTTIDDILVVVGNIVHSSGSARFDNVEIDGNEIDTSVGGLTLDSSSGLVTVDDNLQVNGDITLSGNVNGTNVIFSGNVTAQGGTFGNVTVGLADDQTITTSAGKLILDAATNEVEINADIDHNGALNTSGNLVCGGSGTFSNDVIAFSSSDINLKKDITPIDNALDMVNRISGNTFTWNTTLLDLIPYENGTKDTGILAQEVEALGLPGLTTTRHDGVKAVRYERLIPVLIEAIKELKSKVEDLQK